MSKVGLGKNVDSSKHCNLLVLDSDLFFESIISKKRKSILSHCNLEASMPKCKCSFTFVHVMIITFMLQV